MTDDPILFYDDYCEREWTRLAEGVDGRLEWAHTVAKLDAVLPDEGRVLDVGGGAGRYAAWLADRGHRVTLVDVSAGQLAVARERLAERGVADRVDLVRGTVDDLGVAADAADATLCLGGPLSHLLDAADRERAVRDLARVTRSGGPVCVSVMGLLGFVQLKLLTGHNVRALPDLLSSGDYDDDLLDAHGLDNEFTATHLFRRAEPFDLLETDGITVDRVTGLEGPASPLHDDCLEELADYSDGQRAALVETVDRLRTDPAVADHSVHVLAVGHV
jgi:Methylase involved in ubiquinone/menaquinone biosynthesis